MKRIVSILVILALLTQFSIIFAVDSIDAKSVFPKVTSNDIIEYATRIAYKHVHALQNIGDILETDEITICDPFFIYDRIGDRFYLSFPVNINGKISYAMEVYYSEDYGYSSSFTDAYAQEFSELLLFKERPYLFTDETGIYLLNKNTGSILQIYSFSGKSMRTYSNNEVENLKQVLRNDMLSLPHSLRRVDRLRVPEQPYSTGRLYLPHVSQGANTCWAAVAASLINYYRGTNHTWQTVMTDLLGMTASSSSVSVALNSSGDFYLQGGWWSETMELLSTP